MKRRRRSRSRKSSGPAAPATSSRSGEPTYPHRAGETTASSGETSSCCSSSSRSGDAQEEALFDGEETSLPLKMDKKQESTCSRECGKVAQDEDEDGQSDKKPCSAVENQQHSGKIGVHAIEEHKQEQGSARGHVQALHDMDDETIANKIWCFTKHLNFGSPERRNYGPEYESEQLMELYEQLAFYRIRAYELTVDRKLDKLDDVNLKLQHPPSKLEYNDFFEYYEESLEWYFDLEHCKNAQFDNYQRLVLHGPRGYVDWDFYRTIEKDLAYVQYFEAVAKQTKWIEYYPGDSMIQWKRVEGVAYMQALEIAADFPDVFPFLVSYGFKEYICSVLSDCSRKGLDGLYFEIWKRVAKGKMSFEEALLEIHSKDMFPLRSSDIKHELENTPDRFPIKDYYDAHVAGIDKMAADYKARQLIREAVAKIVSSLKRKFYLDYARKKLDIARDINLIPKGIDFQQAHTDKVSIINMQFLNYYCYLLGRRGSELQF
ncbi:uncharacterized protein C2845_PM07G21230 [Panicum miliaceum]|uniref:Uncharacterized protein n=1 Tax=Panicum miliaceum TaxID=4540 RepID=A0A3L6SMK5_PANMI|nr:uncharacterized protein C2845_PM07G21230 [Panicum miliaceum]